MRDDAVAWHDVECAAYTVDLALWRELADAHPGRILDIGCGTGRVALDLASRGHEVTALDSEAELVHELARRARERQLRVDTIVADARTFVLPSRFTLAIAPQQVVQLLGGSAGRVGLPSLCAAGSWRRRGCSPSPCRTQRRPSLRRRSLPPLPDVREIDGWVLSSRPLAMRPAPGGVVVERLRQAVSPSGELSEHLSTLHLDELAPEVLEQEAQEAGLRPVGRRRIPETRDFLGSTVVLLS